MMSQVLLLGPETLHLDVPKDRHSLVKRGPDDLFKQVMINGILRAETFTAPRQRGCPDLRRILLLAARNAADAPAIRGSRPDLWKLVDSRPSRSVPGGPPGENRLHP